MLNICSKVMDRFYLELCFHFTVMSKFVKEPEIGWAKNTDDYDAMLNCLNSLVHVMEPLGGVSKVETARGPKSDLPSTLLVTFKIPAKNYDIAKSNAKLLLEGKGISYTSSMQGEWITVNF